MLVIIPLAIIAGVLAWMLRPGTNPCKPRRVAIIVTVVPVIILAVAAVIFQLLHNAGGNTWVSVISNALFVIGCGLLCAAIVAALAFAVARKTDIAKSAGFGACIDFFILAIELGLLEWLAGV